MIRKSSLKALSGLFLLISIAYNACWTPCMAGDQMNINFLIQQGIKKDEKLQKWQSVIADELLGASLGDHAETGMGILNEGMYGATFGLNSFSSNLITGLAATGIGLTSYLFSDIRDSHGKKKMRDLVSDVKLQRARLELEIQNLYAALRDGSPDARAQLIKLTDAATVEEVENNIAMEAYFKAHRNHMDVSAQAN